MFGHLKHISPRTKILFFAILLILLPSAVLSYLGLQSINEKAENLKANYRGTVSLVRDKIEREVLRLEEGVRTFLNEAPPDFSRPFLVKAWLRDIESRTLGIKHPFLVNDGGGVISTSVSLRWSKPRRSALSVGVVALEDFQAAEATEFAKKEYPEAIELYQKALAKTNSRADRAFVQSRIGRCFFKMGKLREAIAEYNKVLKFDEVDVSAGGVPYPVVALTQIADAYDLLNDETKRAATLLELCERLIRFPWDLEGGEYSYYLNSTIQSLESYKTLPSKVNSYQEPFSDLKIREKNLLEEIQFVNSVAENISPQILSTITRGSDSDLQAHRIISQLDGSICQIGYFALPASFRQQQIIATGFEIDKDYVVSRLLPEVLRTVDLGKEVVVGILDEKGNVQYLQEEVPKSTYLVGEHFSEVLPSWEVTLFHRDGKTIEDLIGKEKRLYLALFLGILLVMVVGIVVIARAAAHEIEVSRMKSEFVSNVSHELKTPLSLIRMFGETLETGLVTDEAKRKEFYQIIRKESERLTHLINNVLDFSKMDAGTKEYSIEEADVVEIVRSTVEAYKFHIRDLGFELIADYPSQPIVARIDKDAISQALLNLLSNATRYSEDRKYIRVSVGSEESSVQISVEDHGVGIPKEELAKIFQKFYRGRNQRAGGGRGTGLGLTLVKHIAEAHGGLVEVESEVGKGSRFTLRIPAEDVA